MQAPEDINNLTQLRNSLVRTYREILEEKVSYEKAKELAYHAGKIISSVTGQIVYRRARREVPNIPFAE